MRAAIYTRVSSEMQLDGHSLDAQLAVCKRLAQERGWEVMTIYTDQGLSAKTTERPQFRAMMRGAEIGRFDVVIVHKLDRLSRSVVDLLTILHDLEALGVALVSASEQFDFTTAMGKVMLTMLAAFAQWYLDNLSAETAKGKRARAEAGLWNSAIPFGYEVEYKKDGGSGLAHVDENDAEGVRLAFQKYATGQYSDADIARLLNEAGYRPRGRGDRALRLFSKDTVTAMLQNRFYLGEVQYKGERFDGVHEAIISEHLFAQAQAARTQRRSKRRHLTARHDSRIYPLTGVARCARCGGRMRGSWANGRYYRDPARDRGGECGQRVVGADDAEGALGAFLGRLQLPADWQARIMGQIEQRADALDIAREQARIEGQLERLKKLFVLGDMAEGEYRAERDRLKAQLATMTPPEPPDLAAAAALLADFGAIWDAATARERRCIVHTLLETVYLDAERGPVVAVEPKAKFAQLFEVIEKADPVGSVMMSDSECAPVAPAPGNFPRQRAC
ncbi:MAG: recombinase family protein [Chloroflexota bacterium]